jgi:hypothetical protein
VRSASRQRPTRREPFGVSPFGGVASEAPDAGAQSLFTERRAARAALSLTDRPLSSSSNRPLADGPSTTAPTGRARLLLERFSACVERGARCRSTRRRQGGRSADRWRRTRTSGGACRVAEFHASPAQICRLDPRPLLCSCRLRVILRGCRHPRQKRGHVHEAIESMHVCPLADCEHMSKMRCPHNRRCCAADDRSPASGGPAAAAGASAPVG